MDKISIAKNDLYMLLIICSMLTILIYEHNLINYAINNIKDIFRNHANAEYFR